MADERDREVNHLRELVDVKERALSAALALQAREYERRLNELNHAHARAVDVANKSVSREVYDADQRAYFARQDSALKEIELIRREVSVDLAKRTGRTEMVAIFAVVLSLLAPLALRIFFP